jgi:hypothetical protein
MMVLICWVCGCREVGPLNNFFLYVSIIMAGIWIVRWYHVYWWWGPRILRDWPRGSWHICVVEPMTTHTGASCAGSFQAIPRGRLPRWVGSYCSSIIDKCGATCTTSMAEGIRWNSTARPWLMGWGWINRSLGRSSANRWYGLVWECYFNGLVCLFYNL